MAFKGFELRVLIFATSSDPNDRLGETLLRQSKITLAQLEQVGPLVIHAAADELVPYKHGRRLFEQAHEPKEFLELPGTHNDGYYLAGAKYGETISAFVDKHIRK